MSRATLSTLRLDRVRRPMQHSFPTLRGRPDGARDRRRATDAPCSEHTLGRLARSGAFAGLLAAALVPPLAAQRIPTPPPEPEPELEAPLQERFERSRATELEFGRSPSGEVPRPDDAWLVLGGYVPDYLGDRVAVRRQLTEWNRWSGKKLSIVGIFLDIEDSNPAFNVPTQLEAIWQTGAVPLVNLETDRSMQEVAVGATDRGISAIAAAFADWAGRRDRFAYFAPFPEMNGDWEPYGGDPASYRASFARARSLFERARVEADEARWVFAPNGWSAAGNEFELYYPGDESVDAVGFSGYNWGHCRRATWKEWQSHEKVYRPFVDRMKAMAPTKPIFVLQTATTSQTESGADPEAKRAWLIDSYTYLAEEPAVVAILYFNLDKECDWAVHRPRGIHATGWPEAVSHPAIVYRSPADLDAALAGPVREEEFERTHRTPRRRTRSP